MADHLTPLDAAFLELEEGDAAAHMHVGWAMLCDPCPQGGAPSLADVQALLDERLELLPNFLCRLSSPRVGRLDWPTWERDEELDLANHIRHATLPAPGGEAELHEWIGDFYSHRLDRAHPLWEMILLDGLEGDRWALVAKVHHCLIDGISGASVTTVVLDAEPEPEPGSKGVLAAAGLAGNGSGEEHPGTLGRLAAGARAGVDAALHPRKLRPLLDRSRALADLLIRDELHGAPQTSLNVEISGVRRFDATAAPLADLKQIKRQLGGTVNDVVLAATAGGLRRLFAQRGEEVEDCVRAMVPVSLRQAGESLALGNRVSSLFVELPVAEPDPLLRYHRIAAASEDLKRAGQAGGAEALMELAGAAPPLIHGVAARIAFAPRLFNLTVTNVPGPPLTLYALGAPVRRVLPLVPIFSGHAVGVAAVSYDGQVSFGLNADRGRVPDLAELRSGIEDSLDELRRLAGIEPAPDDASHPAAAAAEN
ncbi:MAG: WS/DGAT/MGAT family O-acyltransferase [Chloroflexota bacterium]